MNDRAVDVRYAAACDTLASRGQQHVLRWWHEIDPCHRASLLAQIESIAWPILDPVIPTHVTTPASCKIPANLAPARVYPRSPDKSLLRTYRKAAKTGRWLLQKGSVAVFTVAGGQATRLGADVPKGAVPVTPVGGKTLFELFAAMVLAAREKYGATIPWYLMTSEANHEATLAFFRERDFLGLPHGEVYFLVQGMLPTFTREGKLILDQKDRLAMAPNGHGGSLKALVDSGAIDDMRRRGVEYISYFQVDNPLVKPFDELFIGLHAETGSEMSTKVAAKADDLEPVGNVCTQDGQVTVIEYSDFPDGLARARNNAGSRTFDAANLAIHVISVDFVRRIAGESFQLPFRRADKAVPFIDDQGNRVVPDRPNGVKLETFVFDALPLAKNAMVFETDRAEEFSPVKNATGPDSLETAKRDQVARAVRWLSMAGVSVPRNSSGDPDVALAISPRFALDYEDLKAKAHLVPELRPGDRLYIE